MSTATTITNSANQPKPEWIEDQVFGFLDDPIVVVVKKLPLRRPKYSIEVRFEYTKEGQPVRRVPHIPVKLTGQGRLELESVSDRIGQLVAQAEEYIVDQAQKTEDEFWAWKQKREMEQLERLLGNQQNKKKKKYTETGKTARQKAKKKEKEKEKTEKKTKAA